MLTKLQAKNLVMRNSIDPTTRAKNDYAVIKKVESFLDDIEDLDKILSYLPKDKIQKYLTDRHVSTLLKASSALMRQLDYRILCYEENAQIFALDNALGKTQPDVVDIKRTKMLAEHVYALGAFYNLATPEEILKLIGYKKPTYPASNAVMWHKAKKAAERDTPE